MILSRENAKNIDFSDLLDEETEKSIKEYSVVSMGTEIAEKDFENITYLCTQLEELNEYRHIYYFSIY